MADRQLCFDDLVTTDGEQKNLIRYYADVGGELWLGDAVDWLAALPSASVDLVFADPPYNVRKAEWDTFESQQAYVDWSLSWIKEAARVLKPTGTLYICGYSEIQVVSL